MGPVGGMRTGWGRGGKEVWQQDRYKTKSLGSDFSPVKASARPAPLSGDEIVAWEFRFQIQQVVG